jgi:hypothetical protein
MHSLTLTSPELAPVRRKTTFAVALAGAFVFGSGLKLNPTKRCFRFGGHVFVNKLKHVQLVLNHQLVNLYQHYTLYKDTHEKNKYYGCGLVPTALYVQNKLDTDQGLVQGFVFVKFF